jgi:hypothetical protein
MRLSRSRGAPRSPPTCTSVATGHHLCRNRDASRRGRGAPRSPPRCIEDAPRMDLGRAPGAPLVDPCSSSSITEVHACHDETRPFAVRDASLSLPRSNSLAHDEHPCAHRRARKASRRSVAPPSGGLAFGERRVSLERERHSRVDPGGGPFATRGTVLGWEGRAPSTTGTHRFHLRRAVLRAKAPSPRGRGRRASQTRRCRLSLGGASLRSQGRGPVVQGRVPRGRRIPDSAPGPAGER